MAFRRRRGGFRGRKRFGRGRRRSSGRKFGGRLRVGFRM